MLRAIRETGYVADPVARRLAARHNRILGVFTYEPVFPSAQRDFYHPFLVGIEERAERLGCDLLLSHQRAGRRRPAAHLPRRQPAAPGRRLHPARPLARPRRPGPARRRGAPVRLGRPPRRRGRPGAVRRRRLRRRHRGARPARGRARGTSGSPTSGGAAGPSRRPTACAASATASAGSRRVHRASDTSPTTAGRAGRGARPRRHGGRSWRSPPTAWRSTTLARERGLRVPEDLSIVALGEPTRAAPPTDVDFSGFRIPRQEMGAQAVDVLTALIEGTANRSGCCPASRCTVRHWPERNAGADHARRRCWSSAAASAGSPRRWPRCGPGRRCRADRGVRLARRAADQPGGAAGRALAGSSSSASPRSYRALRDGIRDYYRGHYPLTDAARGRGRELNPGAGHVSRLCHEPRVAVAVIEAMLAPYRGGGRLTVLQPYRPVAAETDGDRVTRGDADAPRQRRRGSSSRAVRPRRHRDRRAAAADRHRVRHRLRVAATRPASRARPPRRSRRTCRPSRSASRSTTSTATTPSTSRPRYDFWRDVPAAVLGRTGCSSLPLAATRARSSSSSAASPRTRTTTRSPVDADQRLQPRRRQPVDVPAHRRAAQLRARRLRQRHLPRELADDRLLRGARSSTCPTPTQHLADGPRAVAARCSTGCRPRRRAPTAAPASPACGCAATSPATRRRPRQAPVHPRVPPDPRRVHGRRAGPVAAPCAATRARSATATASASACTASTCTPRPAATTTSTSRSLPVRDPARRAASRAGSRTCCPAGKNIGTTHITNGCYRLHPVEWNIGEVAGALAAYCLDHAATPRAVRDDARPARRLPGPARPRRRRDCAGPTSPATDPPEKSGDTE